MCITQPLLYIYIYIPYTVLSTVLSDLCPQLDRLSSILYSSTISLQLEVSELVIYYEVTLNTVLDFMSLNFTVHHSIIVFCTAMLLKNVFLISLLCRNVEAQMFDKPINVAAQLDLLVEGQIYPKVTVVITISKNYLDRRSWWRLKC